MEKTKLGDRMKLFYENRSKTYLSRRAPVIIRIDGSHFHTLTRKFKKPYDALFIKAMQLTTKKLCENIQGCKIGYVESDEISLLLTDYDTLDTAAWFDNSVQKICSVSASMTACFFNKIFYDLVNELPDGEDKENKLKVCNTAYFDSRCFTIPENEVVNYFIWRQNDATRNSIQGLAQSVFSQKSITGLNNSQLQDKLHEEKNINWNDCSTVEKRGSCIIKVVEDERSKWIVDEEIPIFTKDRDYIEKYLPKAE